jgi:hypothetical protein
LRIAGVLPGEQFSQSGFGFDLFRAGKIPQKMRKNSARILVARVPDFWPSLTIGEITGVFCNPVIVA